MLELSIKNWMTLLFVLSFFMAGIVTFLFGRVSVSHLKREMTREGIEQPIWDKGIGSIGITYALIMVFPKLKPTIVDFEAVRRHTRKKDKKLAYFYTAALFISFIMMFTVAYLYGPDN